MKALLLIDIQNDFLPGGSLAVPEGDKIISIVNDLQQNFSVIIATQDWHPKNHKSFAVNHKGKKPFELIDLNGLQQVLWPEHCVENTLGAEFSQQLNMEKVNTVFKKGTDANIDSYSGFYDNGYLKSTGLSEYLKNRNIKEVFIAGLAADYCVYYTAKDALQEGFETYIIDDAVRAIDKNNYQKSKIDITEKGGKIIESSSIR